jgi:cytochrome c556
MKRVQLAAALAVVLVSALVAADAQQIAVRREMIEMDIAVRNLTSAISIGDRKVLDEILGRLTSWQMKDHPDYGKAFREALGKWENKNVVRFGRQIQAEAQNLRGYISARGKLSDADWAKLSQGLGKILNSCQACHNTLQKDKK